MAAGKHGSSEIAVFLVGGYNFLGNKPQTVNRKVDETIEKTHGLGDSWEESAHCGMSKGAFSQGGAFFDDTTNYMHTVLKSGGQTSRVGLIAWGGNILGAVCTGFAGLFGVGYEVIGRAPGLTKANATYGVSGQVEEGVILQPHAAMTTTTTGTGVDNSAATSNGGACYLEVSAYSGFTSVAIKIQDSADNSSWLDLSGASFTAVTSAPTAQRVAVSGTVRRYLRSVVTPTGSGSITATVAFARTV